MMKTYLCVRDDGVIIGSRFLPDPDAGPTRPVTTTMPGTSLVEDTFNFTREGRRDTEVAYLIDGEIVWVETAVMSDLISQAVANTYTDVDEVYDLAIGRRATEYANAESAARAFLAAEVKPAIVSGYITGHAERNPTGQVQTYEWAAQQIVERADAFRWAELQMRNVRFDRQAQMRAATTVAELDEAVASWKEFVKWLREVLGV